MKKLKILSALLILLIVNISCSDNDSNIELSDKELLTKKEWLFKDSKFLDSSNNNGRYTSQDFENKMNATYKGLIFKFNNDKSGYFKSDNNSNINKNFIWKITGDKLQMIVSGANQQNDIILSYLIKVDDSQLDLTMTEEFVVHIDNNELNIRGILSFN